MILAVYIYAMKHYVLLALAIMGLFACGNNNGGKAKGPSYKHALDIPTDGISTKLGANTQKILEGDESSLIIAVGDVGKEEADITLRLGDKMVFEKLVHEKQSIRFNYYDHPYHLNVEEIKKPLIGSGKVSFTIK